CCEKISSHIAFIKRADISLPLQIRLEREFINRSVHSSTWIEGNRLSFDQVVALAGNKNVIAQEEQKQEVNNCIKTIKWILKNKSKSLIEKRLIKIHEMMTNGLLPTKNCGKYRTVQNYVINSRNVVVFTPPTPAKVKLRIDNLLAWIKKFKNEHPIIRSAIFHHEFVTIHPFIDGNGRVARAASQLLLFERGYDPLHTLNLDDFFAKDRGRYYDMIQQTRDMDGDYSYWIDYVAEGLLDSVQEISDRLKTVRRTKGTKKVVLTPKQEELLNLLSEHGIMGSSQICECMKINRARVNQLIAPLVKVGIVIKEGTTRAVRYSLA
ncbi:hypothetical protein MNBD_BACTEROID05-467, partial [hydrothermal vent metagenome]